MVGLPVIIAFLLFTMGFSYFYTFKFLAVLKFILNIRSMKKKLKILMYTWKDFLPL